MGFFKNLSINIKLGVLCAILILPFSGLVVYLLGDMKASNHLLESIYKNNFTASSSIKETRFIISKIVSSCVGLASESIQFEDGQAVLLKYGDETDENSVFYSWQKWRDSFSSGKDILSSEQVEREQELIVSLTGNMDTFLAQLRDVLSEIADLDEDDFESDLIDSAVSEMSYLGITLEEQFRELDGLEEQKVIALYNRANTKFEGDASRSFALLIALLVISILVAAFISRSLIGPINGLCDIFHEFVETGDLRRRSDNLSKDELGKLNQYFNEFVERFHTVFTDIQKNGTLLFDASHELAQLSTEMEHNSEKMQNQLTQIIQSIRAVSTAMNRVLEHVDEVTENSHSLADSMEELTDNMGSITSSTEHAADAGENARDQVRDADVLMRDLEKRAAEVSDVIQIISGIANNTKLLSLNATIEAARAGDAGKGFAVVSSEVKELSRRTSDGVKLIVENSTNIQSATTASADAMQRIAEIIEELGGDNSSIAKIVNEQSATTREISSTVLANFNALKSVSQEVQETTSRIVQLAGEQSQEDLRSGSILNLENAVNEVSEESRRVNTRADELAHLGEELNKAISQFKI